MIPHQLGQVCSPVPTRDSVVSDRFATSPNYYCQMLCEVEATGNFFVTWLVLMLLGGISIFLLSGSVFLAYYIRPTYEQVLVQRVCCVACVRLCGVWCVYICVWQWCDVCGCMHAALGGDMDATRRSCRMQWVHKLNPEFPTPVKVPRAVTF